MRVWILSRVPPANEILGGFHHVEAAKKFAEELEPGLAWSSPWPSEHRAGLWRINPVVMLDRP